MTFLNAPPALDWPLQFCVSTTAITYIASLVTSNVSQVDRVWTFLPTIYTAYFALLPWWPNDQPFFLYPYTPKAIGWVVATTYSPRALLMLSLTVIWMFRLSYNTYRRGLFNLKDEDYRWVVLRTQIPPWLFQVTNLTFIAGVQNILLLLLGLPTLTAATLQPHTALETSDLVCAGVILVLLALEFTADNQQFAFQTYKHAFLAKEKGIKGVEPYDARKQWPGARLAWTPDDARRGFVTRGLWRYSRHPNFECEQLFWWVITWMPIAASSPPSIPVTEIVQAVLSFNNPSSIAYLRQIAGPTLLQILPALALTALFESSTAYTEAITASKYRVAYAAYRQRVGTFLPTMTLAKYIYLKVTGGNEAAEKKIWGSVDAKTKTA